MSDEFAPKPAKKPRGAAFKPGYDPRRWLKGRGKKSPEQREGEKILLAVIWDELSREFDPTTGKPLTSDETLDALRLMVRNMLKKKPEVIIERIAGKVQQNVAMEINAKGIGVKYVDYRNGIAQTAPRPDGDSEASSEDEGAGDGEKVG